MQPSDTSNPIDSSYPKQGNSVTRLMGRSLLKGMGWTYEGEWPNVPKLIAIGAPHTSNWDLGLAMGFKLSADLKLSWMMKREAFVWPLGPLWKAMGGIPIDRKAAQDVVEQMAEAFRNSDKLHLGLTPEGSRSNAFNFRKGYLRIAKAAQVPVFILGVDAPNRQVILDKFWPLTGDIDADNAAIEQYYRDNYNGIRSKKD